jgi:hypothetical protein
MRASGWEVLPPRPAVTSPANSLEGLARRLRCCSCLLLLLPFGPLFKGPAQAQGRKSRWNPAQLVHCLAASWMRGGEKLGQQ